MFCYRVLQDCEGLKIELLRVNRLNTGEKYTGLCLVATEELWILYASEARFFVVYFQVGEFSVFLPVQPE